MTTVAPTPTPIAAPMTWAVMKRQIQEKQAAEAAAYRAEFGPQSVLRNEAQLREAIGTYNSYLDTQYVQNHGALLDWVRRQKAAAMRELTALTMAKDGAK